MGSTLNPDFYALHNIPPKWFAGNHWFLKLDVWLYREAPLYYKEHFDPLLNLIGHLLIFLSFCRSIAASDYVALRGVKHMERNVYVRNNGYYDAIYAPQIYMEDNCI